MTKTGFLVNCRDAENPRSVRRSIRACLIVGAVVATGLAAIAVTGGHSVQAASSAGSDSTMYRGAQKPTERSGTILAHRIVY
jgi:hypothetical protein